MSTDAEPIIAVPDLVSLRAERDQAEQHIVATDRQGGCQQSMFLGDCPDCERYFSLDDQVRAIEVTS